MRIQTSVTDCPLTHRHDIACVSDQLHASPCRAHLPGQLQRLLPSVTGAHPATGGAGPPAGPLPGATAGQAAGRVRAGKTPIERRRAGRTRVTGERPAGQRQTIYVCGCMWATCSSVRVMAAGSVRDPHVRPQKTVTAQPLPANACEQHCTGQAVWCRNRGPARPPLLRLDTRLHRRLPLRCKHKCYCRPTPWHWLKTATLPKPRSPAPHTPLLRCAAGPAPAAAGAPRPARGRAARA